MKEGIEEMIKKLGEIPTEDPFIKDYLEETKKCFSNDCFRSTVILLWNLFMYFLYKKIEEYGLREFAKIAKEKNVNFEGKLNNFYDVNKISDSKVIELCHNIGFYDRGTLNQLKTLSQLRNNCAHITQPKLSSYRMLSFVDETVNYINTVNSVKYESLEKTFIEELKNMSREQIKGKIKSMNFKKLKITIEKIIDKISLISEQDEYIKYKGLFDFVLLSIENRDDNNEKVQLFEIILTKIIFGGVTKVYIFKEKMAEYTKFSCIKEYILKEKQLDLLITFFVDSSTYERARKNAYMILNFNNFLTPEHVNLIAEATISNSQLKHSTGAKSPLRLIFTKHKDEVRWELKKELIELGISF